MAGNTEEKIKINKTQLENILRLGFSQKQVCDFFGTSRTALTRFITKEYGPNVNLEPLKAENTAQTQSIIMMNLLNLSKRNAHVAIFLAKSICGLNENYSAPVNEEAENAFAGALKKASRSISQAKDLVSIPDNDGSGEDIL